MRRLAALLLLGGTAMVLALGFGDEKGGGVYRVDALFDNAGFLIAGQDVKIAGARVGEVTEVSLTKNRKARISMAVEKRYGPWRDDADCTIQPQSLIGEKFVQCTPGTPRGKPLTGSPDTLSVRNTHAPIDPDLVFAAFRAPTPDRLRILVAELGGGLAGRSEDLSATIRRANPALQHTQRVLSILEGDRARLQALTSEAERVVGALTRERSTVVRAVRRGARVTTRVARRRRELGSTLERLPALLREARPAVRSLKALTDNGRPILDDVRTASPALSRLGRDLGPLATAARPALDRLGDAAETGGPILRRAAPLVRDLQVFARSALPTGRLVAELFTSLRDRGAVEGISDFAFYAAQATARFDRYSHIIPAHLMGSECSQYATVTVKECSAWFSSSAGRNATSSSRAAPRAGRDSGPDRPRSTGQDKGERGRAETPPDRGRSPEPSDAPKREPKLLDELPTLPDLPSLPAVPDIPPLDDVPPPVKLPKDGKPSNDDLLDYLLG